jgi:subtilisin family serine protease
VRARIVLIVLMVVASMPFGVPATAHAAACGQSITAPLPDKPWPLRRLRPELVWPLTTGKRIIVAVIDSGVSPAHPALAGQVLPGIDLVDPTGDGTCDEAGHGTLIAGIIAGLPTPSSGFRGLLSQRPNRCRRGHGPQFRSRLSRRPNRCQRGYGPQFPGRLSRRPEGSRSR